MLSKIRIMNTYCYHLTIFKNDKLVTRLSLYPVIDGDGRHKSRVHHYYKVSPYICDQFIYCDYTPSVLEESIFHYEKITMENWIQEAMFLGFQLQFDSQCIFSSYYR